MRQPAVHHFTDDGRVPNNPRLAVLVYEGVAEIIGEAAACERLFAGHGWGNAWRNGIYPFHHYHSTAHEALGIVAGRARVQLGGPGGQVFELTPGTIVVLPAGSGHCNLGASADLLVVGAYPPGQQWDLRRGDPADRPGALENIAAVPLPETDPVHGPDGPLVGLWR